MTSPCQPYHEPLRSTLLRTGLIALGIGAVLAWRTEGLSRWPMLTLLALWPSLGGHFVEILFLNVLRPRLPVSRAVQLPARIAIWFAAGIVFALCMTLTASALTGVERRHFPIWIAGCAFIGIELVAHLVLQLRGCPSFYNGRG
jgi:hypothetical protein